MHPDWQSVKRLLVASLLDQDSQLVLRQVLLLLQQSLPQVNITVLAAFPDTLPNHQLSSLVKLSLPFPFSDLANRATDLIHLLKDRSFDAAIGFTSPAQSPYLIAYCCYLAGIPIRVGQSGEFSGGVLSHCIKPPIDPVDVLAYQLHLLRSVGLAIDESVPLFASDSSSVQSIDLAIIRE